MAAVARRTPIVTPGALELERLVVDIQSAPEIIAARDHLMAAMELDPVAGTPEGLRTIARSHGEIARAFATTAITADTARPELVWWLAPPHRWDGRDVPGARFGLDNPDNFYQAVAIDPESDYVIRGRRRAPGPTQVSFIIYEAHLLTDDAERSGVEQATLLNPVVDQDGRYEVTISKQAFGGQNHLHNSASGRFLVIRQTLSDWQSENPDILSVQRISAEPSPPMTRQQVIEVVAEVIERSGPYWLDWQRRKPYGTAPNILPIPRGRDGNWGYATNGNFSIEPEEALLVTVNPAGARYVAIQAGDPWCVSVEYVRRTGSLNGSQAWHAADGTITYIISPSDPGRANWLDTGGLSRGTLFLRWQELAPTSPDGLLRSVKVVRIAGLNRELPAGMPAIGPSERRRQGLLRAQAWARRLYVDGH